MEGNWEEVYKKILAGADFCLRSGQMLGATRRAHRGQFVLVGMGMAPDIYRIGYVVQIRLGQGAFGSDLYLIRHADGTYQQHANNFYLEMDFEEIDQVAKWFEAAMPGGENFDDGYILNGDPETLAIGFLIDKPEGFIPAGAGRFRVSTLDSGGNVTSATDTVCI